MFIVTYISKLQLNKLLEVNKLPKDASAMDHSK